MKEAMSVGASPFSRLSAATTTLNGEFVDFATTYWKSIENFQNTFIAELLVQPRRCPHHLHGHVLHGEPGQKPHRPHRGSPAGFYDWQYGGWQDLHVPKTRWYSVRPWPAHSEQRCRRSFEKPTTTHSPTLNLLAHAG